MGISLEKKLPTIQIDTREKLPYKFNKTTKCAGSVVDKLDFGDYAVQGYPGLIAIERKNGIDELCNNFGNRREQFKAELSRMQQAKYKYVIIEDHWSSIFSLHKHSTMHPNSILGTIISFELKYGVHFIFAGSKEMAHTLTRVLLLKAYEITSEQELEKMKCQ